MDISLTDLHISLSKLHNVGNLPGNSSGHWVACASGDATLHDSNLEKAKKI